MTVSRRRTARRAAPAQGRRAHGRADHGGGGAGAGDRNHRPQRWTAPPGSGRLAFDDLPLTEVAARFNRYSAALPGGPRLTMGDGEVGALRVSGRVRADNLRSFVEVLETNFGITAESRDHGEIVLRRRAAAR